MIARLICKFLGHRRGKRISMRAVQCPRCSAVWPREQKVKPA